MSIDFSRLHLFQRDKTSSNVINFESLQPSTVHYVTTKIKHVKTVSSPNNQYQLNIHFLGGQIGHRKYDCPEQRNFTANIICRVCGNAGHMAKDCPDRQRGANWRNDAPGPVPARGPAGRIGGGDAVDREYEVSS